MDESASPAASTPSSLPEPSSDQPSGHEPDVQLSLANERTFLAWERTALGLITAGLAITQLLPAFDFPGARRLIGLPLIGLGILISLVSFWEWRANQEAMRHDRPLPRSFLPLTVAIVVGLVAVIGFVLVIVDGAGS
jgi:putative membrane protein